MSEQAITEPQQPVSTPASEPPSVAMRLGMAWARARRHAWVEPLVLFAVFWLVYLASGTTHRTPYVAHVYLANALLHGHWDIPNPPGHFELVWFKDKAYLPYGIGPSLLMLPFVTIWGTEFHQAVFNAGLGALCVAIWWPVVGYMTKDMRTRWWLLLTFAVGNPFWFYAGKNGATWSLMHMATLFGLSIAMLDIFGKRRGWLTGAGLGIAMLARQNTILAAPFFAYMLIRPEQDPETPASPEPVVKPERREIGFIVAVAAFLAFNAFYNWARFGSPSDNGYARFILGKDHPASGIFSLDYFWKNVDGYFTLAPVIDVVNWHGINFPWPNPTYDGPNIWLGMPALVLAFVADYRSRVCQLALVTIGMIMTVYLFYYWSGWTQFGRRYFLDAVPFAMVLIASGAQRFGVDALRRATIFGIIVEIWGLTWWTLKGW